MGWVILECSEEVRLGIMRLLSIFSRVTGRSLVLGRVKEVCAVREGAMAAAAAAVYLGSVEGELRLERGSFWGGDSDLAWVGFDGRTDKCAVLRLQAITSQLVGDNLASRWTYASSAVLLKKEWMQIKINRIG